jgi:hypothetical protein
LLKLWKNYQKVQQIQRPKSNPINSLRPVAAATTTGFIFKLQVIDVYYTKFEPVYNQLQQVNMNLKTVNNYITKLVDILQLHKNSSSTEFTVIFTKTKKNRRRT